MTTTQGTTFHNVAIPLEEIPLGDKVYSTAGRTTGDKYAQVYRSANHPDASSTPRVPDGYMVVERSGANQDYWHCVRFFEAREAAEEHAALMHD